MRLTKLGKIVFTILLVIISIIVYTNLGKIGEITSRNLQELLAILGWGWLFIQPFILSYIWEKQKLG
jgi:hypothetical protein